MALLKILLTVCGGFWFVGCGSGCHRVERFLLPAYFPPSFFAVLLVWLVVWDLAILGRRILWRSSSCNPLRSGLFSRRSDILILNCIWGCQIRGLLFFEWHQFSGAVGLISLSSAPALLFAVAHLSAIKAFPFELPVLLFVCLLFSCWLLLGGKFVVSVGRCRHLVEGLNCCRVGWCQYLLVLILSLQV